MFRIFRKNAKLNPYSFFEKEKKRLKINSDVSLKLDFNKSDNDNCFSPQDELIICGVKGYDFNNLPSSKVTALKNTICHELVHARNRKYAPKEILEQMAESKRTMAVFGYRIFDDFCAYYEANKRYLEDSSHIAEIEQLKTNINNIASSPRVLTAHYGNTESGKVKQFNDIIEALLGVVVRYCVLGYVDEHVKENVGLNRAANYLKALYGGRHNVNMYEYIGFNFLLFCMDSIKEPNRRKNFITNTCIAYIDKQQYQDLLNGIKSLDEAF